MSAPAVMPNLVVIETQKIKSYVFGSPAMREIRGASLTLDRFNRQTVRNILNQHPFKDDHETVYIGGGAGRVLFKTASIGELFCRFVEEESRKETVTGRIACEMVRARNGESYAQLQSRALALTRMRKTARREALPTVAGRWIRPCSSCGQMPAETTREEHGRHYLCPTCNRKRDEVNQLYRMVKMGERGLHQLKPSAELRDRYGEDFIFTTLAIKREVRRDGGTLLPQDFRDIGACSRPANYMAFIYADGNAMGEMLRQIGRRSGDDAKAKATYRAFSQIVDRACREAAVEAVLKNVPAQIWMTDGGPAKMIPAEFILAGGDDLMLVVPAHCGLDVAADFLDLYQAKTRCLQHTLIGQSQLAEPFAPEGLFSSAGLVIAHDHYPIRQMMELASELMKIAKHRFANQPASPPMGTLDFMVLSESTSGPVKKRRQIEYRTDSNCSLTRRPYTTREVRELCGTIRALKEADTPRNKVKKLYDALFQSPLQAQYDGLRLRERLVATGALRAGSRLAKAFEPLSAFPFEPVEGEPGKWRTPLSELAEFYDYVHPRS